LITGTRPDLAYSVGYLSRKLDKPTTDVVIKLKRKGVVGHQKVVSLSHLTYFVQLLYLGKLLNLKIRRFSRKQLFVILINKVQQ